MIRHPPRSPLSPSTPLSQSADENRLQILRILMREGRLHVSKICDELGESQPAVSHHLTQLRHAGLVDFSRERSEEHTSELQSPCNLVCRLLLEKKKLNDSTTRRKSGLTGLFEPRES